ncbi:MAG: hypothetical protein ABSE79_15760 [Terriglobia bacterium]
MDSRGEEEIKKANQLAVELGNLVASKGECPPGDRNTPLIAYWSLAFDHHRGVLCLLWNKLFGSAFALVRPLVEATVRAHVVVMGSEEDVRKLRNDEYRTNFGTVGNQIDAFFGTGDWFESFLNRAKNALHSYTHAGLSQLGRRFSGNDVTPSYSEEEIIDLIRTSTIAAFLVTKLVTKHFGFEQEERRCGELFGEWGKHPRTSDHRECWGH